MYMTKVQLTKTEFINKSSNKQGNKQGNKQTVLTIIVPPHTLNKPSKTNNTYKKYKDGLDLLDKYIDNDIIYDVIYNWGTQYKNKFYELHSHINRVEGVYISEMIKAYIKPSMKNINVLEIGCAFGTSAMFIMNILNQYKKKIQYKVVDPNQDTQWNSVGLYNIARVKKDNIDVEWLKGNSDVAMEHLTKSRTKYDIVFIDGGHSFEIVMNDSEYADKLLKKNGLVLHDDVLHGGVHDAIEEFYENNADYQKVILEYPISKPESKPRIVKDTKRWFLTGNKRNKSFTNPATMYGFRKVK